MSILRVARSGHPVLRQVALPVAPEELGSPLVQRLIDDMLETVEAYDGAGLAAPQVHESRRIVVLQLDAESGMQVWVNPELDPYGDEAIVTFEGCLSVPGMRAAVARTARVRVKALDRDGNHIELDLQGFPAVVAQHECDHLDGVLYIDRMDPRTLAFNEELRRFGPWPWDDDDIDDEFEAAGDDDTEEDQDDLSAEDLEEALV